MNDYTEQSRHIDFESLNDYVDGRLDARAIALADRHLAQCGDCAAELRSLRALVAATAALPKSVLPDDDIWADLKASIDEQKAAVLPMASPVMAPAAATGSIHRNPWRYRAWLAVAAVLLVVVSSTVTTLVLRRNDQMRVAVRDSVPTSPTQPPAATSVLPRSFGAAEGTYTQTIEELRMVVDGQRSQLKPETIRTVDRSLAVVDSAITEARAALLADPNNRTLVDLLSASYQRKLDLLRRASELSSRT